jgi:hypothetical protein
MHPSIESFITSPIFAPIESGLRQFQLFDKLPVFEELNSVLQVEKITFVPQQPKSDAFSESYEPRIYLKGEVQTREDNWHDFFNALMWHRFPLAKKVINRLQYQLQKSRHPNKQRLPAENMLTLFDENGAIVLARDPALLDLIRGHHWHELFWQRREQIKRDLKVCGFGHALYEKAVHPYLGLTAKCLLFVDPQCESIDAFVAGFLADKGHTLRTADLSPLPILGLPGWWPENTDEAFYKNEGYFRPRLQ